MKLQTNIINRITLVGQRAPNAAALTLGDKTITYAQLLEDLDKIAAFLSTHTSTSNFIGIGLYKDIRCVQYILGAMKAGLVCVPINTSWSTEHLKTILKETGLNCIITDDLEYAKINRFTSSDNIRLINIDAPHLAASNNICNKSSYPDNIAYVLYTSGSSGKPKGVQVSHANLVAIADSWDEVFHLSENSYKHLQLAHYSFDVFFGDLIRALCYGHELVLCPKKIMLSPKKLYELIKTKKINFTEFTPYVLRKLIKYCRQKGLLLNTFKILACGSDLWTIGEYNDFRTFISPDARLVNTYGLTEATIDSAFYEANATLHNQLDETMLVPIGSPLPSIKLFLLDKHNQVITEEHRLGEICIAGSTVALGYVDSRLNQNKFMEISLNGRMHRILKTGDYGYYLKYKLIQLVGRQDSQVKLHGRRIELSAIEARINGHPLIKSSMVALVHTEEKSYLAAHIHTQDRLLLNASLLKRYLRITLPNHMVPTKFYYVDKIHLNNNGKIIRQFMGGLPLPETSQSPVKLNDSLEEKILELCLQAFHYPTLYLSDKLISLGISKRQYEELCKAIKHHFKINLALENFNALSDMEALINYIKAVYQREFNYTRVVEC